MKNSKVYSSPAQRMVKSGVAQRRISSNSDDALAEDTREASRDFSAYLTTRLIRRRYTLGLCLIALLSICSGVFTHVIVAAQEHNANVVNIAGRQRMLSQRSALFAQLLIGASAGEWTARQLELRKALDLMERSHEALSKGDAPTELPAPTSVELKNMYFAAPLEVDRQVRDFIASGRAILAVGGSALKPDNPDLRAMLSASSQPLLSALDAVTNRYAAESQLQMKTLQLIETAVVGLLLVALLLESLLIFRPMEREVGQRSAALVQAYDETIEGWSRALDLRDHETEGHSIRVTEMTYRLAQLVGMSAEDLPHVRRGALLHDIGKVGIPDAILLKPAQLSEAEWEIMRRHPTYAGDLLRPIAFLRPALDIPLHHHERWDGTGYPAGLSQNAIPFAARLFAVVDIWDALSSKRPYREAWSATRVREHISSLAGSHLDPTAVALFLTHETTVLAGLYSDSS